MYEIVICQQQQKYTQTKKTYVNSYSMTKHLGVRTLDTDMDILSV